MNPLNLIRKKMRLKRIKQHENEMELATDSVYSGMDVIFMCSTDKKRLKVGHHCIIDGIFIFERDSGRMTVGDRVHIGGNTKLISINEIELGDDVTIAWDCTIYDHNSHSIYWEERKNDTEKEYHAITNGRSVYECKNWSNVKSGKIKIDDKVWIGFGVTVLNGVHIGEGAVIGSGSVVTSDIPAWSVAAGNPARVIKKIER